MAELFPTGEPYRLHGRRMTFATWYYVKPSTLGWFDAAGKSVAIVGDQEAFDPSVNLKHQNAAWGIQIRAESAQRSEPLFRSERPWEAGGVNITTMFKDGGTYRAWGDTNWGDLNSGQGYCCYFESEDGFNWKRPDCGIIEHLGTKKNNLLFSKLANRPAYGGAVVFTDPSAADAERYKLVMFLGNLSQEDYERYARHRPDAIDPKCAMGGTYHLLGIVGAVSRDGLDWRGIEEPLVMIYSDAPPGMFYDPATQTYVGYFRDWMQGPADTKAAGDMKADSSLMWRRFASSGRRAIGIAETKDFRKFPLPRVIIEPSPWMSPNQVFYLPTGKTTIPGAPDQHLLFASVWDTATDTTHIEMLASHDARLWHYMPGGKVLQTAAPGQWDGGCVFAVPTLTELANGDFVLPYIGYSVPHKYPRRKATRNTGYAMWPKGRIASLEAADEGGFTTVAVVPPGQSLLINAVVQRAGHIRVEALNLDGEPIPGRTFADAIPIVGDQHRTKVVWKGHDNLGIAPGEAVALRLQMKQARLYSLDFEE